MLQRKIRVLVVDDSAVSRVFLSQELQSDPALEVVACAHSGAEAIAELGRHKPDVVTMDIHMPGMDGFEATRQIMETQPLPIVIVSGSYDPVDAEKMFRAMQAGAVAAVEKPPGEGHPNHEAAVFKLIATVKAMAEVRVVRRWKKQRMETRNTEPMPLPRGAAGIKLVAIGASTGGPPVLQTVLAGLRKPFPVPIVIVQHISAGFVQGLVEWLNNTTGMTVGIAQHGEVARPGCAHLAPDGRQMRVEADGRLICGPEPAEHGLRPAVSFLFRSVAQHYGPQAAGVLLTGMGRDGAEELKQMRDVGAVTIAQDEESSIVHGMPGEAIRLGAAMYVGNPERIAAVLQSMVDRGPRQIPRSKTMNWIDGHPPHGVSILIVEDSPTQAMKLMHMLDTQGYQTAVARNGKEALEAITAQAPTLVITDINMPEMDGYELCQHIKDDAKLSELPVILLTTLSDPNDILRGLECGADNFIVKPYDEEFLLSRIQHVLANQELRVASQGKPVTEIYFAGRKFQLHSGRIHSIDLLLSTYETAVQKNLELSRAKEKLEEQACLLREKNAEMAADLEMARELQAALIPRHYPVFPSNSSPERSVLQFCHRFGATTELGGDYFDIRALSETEAGVLVCDVMGHGVRAALVASILRGLTEELKAIAAHPGRFLTEINRSLCVILKHSPTKMFATAFYLVVDLQRGELRTANAGHPSALHVRRTAGYAEPLIADDEAGPALGIFDTASYAEARRAVSARDMVMMFTDGLYEVERADGSFLEKEDLRATVAELAALPTPGLFDGLLTRLKRESATGGFDDDMCVVGVDIVELLAPPA